ncbi:MAG: T9SS type A sorting domain-containing protein [candidate division Zixibacteria bacterium]|nr:T9SS type A sorting domain-containing protein [candidate division Zixibacteria bacterium]
MLTSIASAYDFNFDFTNTTADTMKGFRIKLVGQVTPTNFYDGPMNPFPDEPEVAPLGMGLGTIITFTGGVIPPGQTIHIGFDVDDKAAVLKNGESAFAAEWLDEFDMPHEAVPIGGCWFEWDMVSMVAVYVSNDCSPNDTITVYNFNYSLPGLRIPLNTLMWDLMAWTPIPGGPIDLAPGEIAGPFIIGPVLPSDYIVFGWEAFWKGYPFTQTRALFQEQAERDLMECQVVTYTPRVLAPTGDIIWDLNVRNWGTTTHDVYAEIYPTVGDCASGTQYDYNVNRFVVDDLTPTMDYTGSYYYHTTGITGIVDVSLWNFVGPSIDNWLSGCCFDFRFVYPFGYSGGEPNWGETGMWLDREDNVSVPTNISLDQNYPNPFNASTTIPFTITKSGNVSLDVYNLSGQLVETVLEEYKNAGQHVVTWDASTYSSGVYFYKLHTADVTITKKMNLMK